MLKRLLTIVVVLIFALSLSAGLAFAHSCAVSQESEGGMNFAFVGQYSYDSNSAMIKQGLGMVNCVLLVQASPYNSAHIQQKGPLNLLLVEQTDPTGRTELYDYHTIQEKIYWVFNTIIYYDPLLPCIPW